MQYLGPVHFRYAPGAVDGSRLEPLARVYLQQLQAVYPRVSTKGMVRSGNGWAMRVMFVADTPVVDIYVAPPILGGAEARIVRPPLAFVLSPQSSSGVYVYPDPWHEIMMAADQDTHTFKLRTAAQYKSLTWSGANRPIVYSVTWDNGVDVCSWHGARYSASFAERFSLRTGKFAVNGVRVFHSIPHPQVILGAGIVHAEFDDSSDTPTADFTCRLVMGKFIESPSTKIVNFAVGVNIYEIYVRIEDGVATETKEPALLFSFEYSNNTTDIGLSRLRGWAVDRTATRCVTIIDSGVDVLQHEIDLAANPPTVITTSYGSVGQRVRRFAAGPTFDGFRIVGEGGFLKPGGGISWGSSTLAAFNSPIQNAVPIAADYDCRTNQLVHAFVRTGSHYSLTWVATGHDDGGVDLTSGTSNTYSSPVELIVGAWSVLLSGTSTESVFSGVTGGSLLPFGSTRIESGGGGMVVDLDIRYGAALISRSGGGVVEYGGALGDPVTGSVTRPARNILVLSDGVVTTHSVTDPITDPLGGRIGDYTRLIYDGIPGYIEDVDDFVASTSLVLDSLYSNIHFLGGWEEEVQTSDDTYHAYGLASFMTGNTVHTLACAAIFVNEFVSALDGLNISFDFAQTPNNPTFPLGVV